MLRIQSVLTGPKPRDSRPPRNPLYLNLLLFCTVRSISNVLHNLKVQVLRAISVGALCNDDELPLANSASSHHDNHIIICSDKHRAIVDEQD